jgi:hypothetical protein
MELCGARFRNWLLYDIQQDVSFLKMTAISKIESSCEIVDLGLEAAVYSQQSLLATKHRQMRKDIIRKMELTAF